MSVLFFFWWCFFSQIVVIPVNIENRYFFEQKDREFVAIIKLNYGV
jgi:hypothetical protein